MTTNETDPITALTAIFDDRRRWGFLDRARERVQVILKSSDPLVPGSARLLPVAAGRFFGGEWELEGTASKGSQFGFEVFVVHKRRHRADGSL